MYQGKIIEYIDEGHFLCTICFQEKGERLYVLTLSNREVTLSPKRILLSSGSPVNPGSQREGLLNSLKQAEAARRELKSKIRVEELWELVREEKQSYDFKYLTQLCFGKAVTDDHVSALVRALFEDHIYFKFKEGRFLPNPQDKVLQLIKQQEEEERREASLSQGSAWLKDVDSGRSVQAPACREDVVNLLVELVLYEKEAPHFKLAKELLNRVGIHDIRQARQLLVKIGAWEEDQNLDLLRLKIKADFRAEQLQEARLFVQTGMSGAGREDLRKLPTFTIDGPFTQDFDDALSIEISPQKINLGIHIADVAGLIPVESLLDKEAGQRASSIYLPEQQIPMLPKELSENILSLRAGEDRPALSLMAHFDPAGTLLDFQFMPSLICVKRQLTYDQVNGLYQREQELGWLYQLIQKWRKQRVEQGALILSLPEVVVNFNQDKAIELELVSQETPSKALVAEVMIFYNWMAARFCRDHNIPALFRGQEPPSEILHMEDVPYLFYVFKQRRKLNPLMVDTTPRPHTGLGLDLYTNMSSPIRRYLDLVVQRQISRFLAGAAPGYDKEALEKIRVGVESVLKELERLRRNRLRYWVIKYFAQHLGESFEGLVLDVLKKKYRIILSHCQLAFEVDRPNGQSFSEGQAVQVKIKKAEAWNDELELEFTG
jgi:exoribonuclease-2